MLKYMCPVQVTCVLCTALWLAFGSVPQTNAAPVPISKYYAPVETVLSGDALKDQLSELVTETHLKKLTYGQVWSVLKKSDVHRDHDDLVILMYGTFKQNEPVFNDDSIRGVDENGGDSDDWNREHVYPKSLGRSNLGTKGPGADAHHLRPCDVGKNSMRGHLPFADGSGNAHRIGKSGWYPGDEWKGDVARMMFYMMIRYGKRCAPGRVAYGFSDGETGMPALFLKWHKDDPVSWLETQRNEFIADPDFGQGNRNPFIDHEEYAERIWGEGVNGYRPLHE